MILRAIGELPGDRLPRGFGEPKAVSSGQGVSVRASQSSWTSSLCEMRSTRSSNDVRCPSKYRYPLRSSLRSSTSQSNPDSVSIIRTSHSSDVPPSPLIRWVSIEIVQRAPKVEWSRSFDSVVSSGPAEAFAASSLASAAPTAEVAGAVLALGLGEFLLEPGDVWPLFGRDWLRGG